MLINLDDYKIVKDKSTYNNTYYKHMNDNTDTMLLETCHEDENFCEYHLVNDKTKVFLGCAQIPDPFRGKLNGEDLEVENKNIKIDMGVFYT